MSRKETTEMRRAIEYYLGNSSYGAQFDYWRRAKLASNIAKVVKRVIDKRAKK